LSTLGRGYLTTVGVPISLATVREPRTIETHGSGGAALRASWVDCRRDGIWSETAQMPEARLLVQVAPGEVEIGTGVESAVGELRPQRLVDADPIATARAHQ